MGFRTFGRGFGPFVFRFGWRGRPFEGFTGGWGAPPYSRRSRLRWLRRYRAELEEELRDVADELRDLERETDATEG